MSLDAYSRVVLTVIAVSLALLAARGWVEPAWAQSMECRISGPIEIRSFNDDLEVRVRDFPNPLRVETTPQSSSTPGSSSTWPLYVRQAD